VRISTGEDANASEFRSECGGISLTREVHLSGAAAELERYQFVNPPEQPLQELTKAGREAMFTKLAARVEQIVHEGR
jgi:hypothetical protein